ncbi:pseudouridylate synthase [Dyadobacter pollutisoli]|uniref:Pseudouridylate synthase n=1 Tax=Dyadobacter pollutisoli TaxID=2910158 RepID=A0A9E8NBB7_9BACT|nr:pseudouridylate synthase [Dyadobacter pollutisoli]WAC11411.1 pseudouridylate synthase [Dyadobacter pollutisoli]
MSQRPGKFHKKARDSLPLPRKAFIDLLLAPTILPPDALFTPFDDSATDYPLPEKFSFPLGYHPHPLGLRAAEMLQSHLENQQEWQHNFGLSNDTDNVIGKMFGVLVVRTEQNEIGYLAAFSGKLAGGNHHAKFVPPIFDGVAKGGFVNAGMTELGRINEEIRMLAEEKDESRETQIRDLKEMRKKHSVSLQKEIFDQYHFLNQAGDRKSLRTIFSDASYKNPPAGAGECAAPKLLQYAFQHRMKPLALAEFWWGMSPKSDFWKHGHFYPACREKCAPILAHMLAGMEIEVEANAF